MTSKYGSGIIWREFLPIHVGLCTLMHPHACFSQAGSSIWPRSKDAGVFLTQYEAAKERSGRIGHFYASRCDGVE